MKNNKEFFDNVSESISKYNPNEKNGLTLSNSKDVANHFRKEFNGDISDQEHFFVAYLNRANKVVFTKKISSGGMTGTVVDIRLILRYALIYKATALILCHNHPSGNLRPSQADRDITRKIKEASTFMDITVLDHIILADYAYYSFCDEGLL